MKCDWRDGFHLLSDWRPLILGEGKFEEERRGREGFDSESLNVVNVRVFS